MLAGPGWTAPAPIVGLAQICTLENGELSIREPNCHACVLSGCGRVGLLSTALVGSERVDLMGMADREAWLSVRPRCCTLHLTPTLHCYHCSGHTPRPNG